MDIMRPLIDKLNALLRRIAARPVLSAILELTFFTAAVALVYRNGVIELPKKDHSSYILERFFVGSDWDWFVHSLSYNRTRFIGPGDEMLFRPAHMAVLALQDIFLRSRLDIQGWLSFVMYGIASWSLYRVMRVFAGAGISLAASLVFVAQYAGMEMVTWRHITPYILGFALYNGALCLLSRSEVLTTRRAIVIGMCVLLATMFHEAFGLASLVLAGVLVFLDGPSDRDRRRMLLMALAAPVAAYALASALDFMHYLQAIRNAVYDPISPSYRPAHTTVTDPLYFIGAVAIGFFLPFMVSFDLGEHWLIEWKLGEAPSISLLSGVVLLAIAVPTAWRAFDRLRRGMGSARVTPLIGQMIFGGTVVISTVLMRVVPRGLEYLDSATYYYAFTTGALCVLMAGVAAAIERQSGNRGRQVVLAGCAILGSLAMTNGYLVDDMLVKSVEAKRGVYDLVRSVRSVLAAHPGYCFAGSLLGDEEASRNTGNNDWSPLLDEYTCGYHPGSQPLVLTSGGGKGFMLSEVRLADMPEYSPVVMRHSPSYFSYDNGRYASVRDTIKGFDESSCLLSDADVLGRSFEFDVENADSFMVILRHEGDRYSGILFLHNKVKGAVDGVADGGYVIPWHMYGKKLHICFSAETTGYVVTVNGVPARLIDRTGLAGGPLAVLAYKNRAGVQVFTGFKVARHAGATAPMQIVDRLAVPMTE